MKSLNPHQPQPRLTPPRHTSLLKNPPPSALIRTPQLVNTIQDLQKSIKNHSKNSKFILHLDGECFNDAGITKALLQNRKASLSLALTLNPSSDLPPFNLYYSLSNLKYLQNITTLNLSLINHSRTKLLSHILKTLKRLTRVSLHIPHHLQNHEINSIFKSLSGLPSLSYLALSFSSSSPRNHQVPSLQLLASHISKLHRLKGLTLHFFASIMIEEEDIADLSPIFTKIPLLSEVDIKFGNVTGTPAEAVMSFFDSLATLKFLKKLRFSLEEDEQYRRLWGIKSHFTGFEKLDMASLHELSLEFDLDFRCSPFYGLSDCLTRSSSLKTLCLDFSKSEGITEYDISQFVAKLKNLSKLSRLALTFPKKNVPYYPGMVKAASENLSSLTGLTDLTLNFKRCPTESVESVELLSSCLEKLTELKRLALIFYRNRTMHSRTLEALMKGIQKLEGLTSLELDLSGHTFMRNEDFRAITSSLSHLQKLRDLKLGFEFDYPSIMPLKAITSILQPLSNLYSFELKTGGEYKNPEKNEIDFFLSVAQGLKNLREINLLFHAYEVPFKIEVGSLKHRKCLKMSAIEYWESPSSF